MTDVTLNPSEVLGLALCLLVLLYVIYNRKTLLDDDFAFITYGFFCVAGSFFFTNLEEFFLGDLINVMEHLLSAAGAMYVAIGCRHILMSSADESRDTP